MLHFAFDEKRKNNQTQSPEVHWFISEHTEVLDLLFPFACTPQLRLHICVANTSVRQWASCQLAFNSSSYFLDRLDTKPALQKTQHPSQLHHWMSICYYRAWVLFPRWPGNCQVSSPTQAIQFSTPIFLKGRKLANKKKCQQSSKPPWHLRAQSCKISIFPVKGWVLSCFVKLFLTARRVSAAHRAISLQIKGGHPLPIYWSLSNSVQIIFKQIHKLPSTVPLVHNFFFLHQTKSSNLDSIAYK